MITARRVKRLGSPWRGRAHLYELSEAVEYTNVQEETRHTRHVIVSAVPQHEDHWELRPETAVFPANEDGGVRSWLCMRDPIEGEVDDNYALLGLGVELS